MGNDDKSVKHRPVLDTGQVLDLTQKLNLKRLTELFKDMNSTEQTATLDYLQDKEKKEKLEEFQGSLKAELNELPPEDRPQAIQMLGAVLEAYEDISPLLRESIQKFIDEDKQPGE